MEKGDIIILIYIDGESSVSARSCPESLLAKRERGIEEGITGIDT